MFHVFHVFHVISVFNNVAAEHQQELLRVSQANKVNNSQSIHSGDFCT